MRFFRAVCCWVPILVAVANLQFGLAASDDRSFQSLEVQMRSTGWSNPFVGMRDISSWSDSLFLLDAEKHRVLVVVDGVIARTIGGIGNGPGEFYYPSALKATTSGKLLIADDGNDRVQILSTAGLFVGEIPSPQVWGVAAGSGYIYLGKPTDSHLVEVYQEDGQHLTAIGELLSPNETFGRNVDVNRDKYLRALNRIHLEADDQGDLWVAFQHVPLLRKYDHAGTLLFETRIGVPGMAELEQLVRNRDHRQVDVPSINIDGVQLPVILRDIDYDTVSRDMLVLFGDGRVAGFDHSGQLLYLIEVSNLLGSAVAITATTNGQALAISTFQNSLQMVDHRRLLSQVSESPR